ncbi:MULTISPECIES: DNA adenine methylase [Clostridium]|uniref:DNA adenine methylase n=1 Tax=Clostridium frigoriphilum TaxID=443253 RepID=A0ABU7UUC3_9CLOT|nr:DNA adenine methylase [Clostridium sp. DSM 17811]MBU3101918.1 DNA adenine methylase [Clostridium sp. DSM 17811]
MALKTLSPFPYFGGKARLASLISDMLDYNNTDLYIEPFGGAARLLFNKPHHKIEIYNDSSAGLCAFMRVMSNKDTANELINRIYGTEYSLEEFHHYMMIRNEAEDHFIDELKRQALVYLKQLNFIYYSEDLEKLRDNIRYKRIDAIAKSYDKVIKDTNFKVEELNILGNFKRLFDDYIIIYKKILSPAYEEQYILYFEEFKHMTIKEVKKEIAVYLDKSKTLMSSQNDKLDFYKKIEKLEKKLLDVLNMTLTSMNKNRLKQYEEKVHMRAKKIAYSETSNNHDNVSIGDMDLAVATYVIYSQSRDGMAKDWSAVKYKSTDDYHRAISRLYDVAERLEGVHVSQVGALLYVLKCPYLNDERAMIYFDPSYLKPEDEKKNLGEIYKDSFTYEDHEIFLKTIYKGKCKMLVSNYNTELYNKYLNADNGWRSVQVDTTTGVGGIKGNGRMEVLWYNYY